MNNTKPVNADKKQGLLYRTVNGEKVGNDYRTKCRPLDSSNLRKVARWRDGNQNSIGSIYGEI